MIVIINTIKLLEETKVKGEISRGGNWLIISL